MGSKIGEIHQEGSYCYTYSPFHKPIARVKAGEPVCTHAVDVFENKMTPEVTEFADMGTYPCLNPQTGPRQYSTRCLPILSRAILCVCMLQLAAIAQPRFEAVTEEAIPFRLFDAMGMSFGDYNNDGWPDLFLAEAFNGVQLGGDRIALLHNLGNGTFALRAESLPAGLLDFNPGNAYGATFGAAVFGDYDRDGDLDLYLPLGANWLHRRDVNALLRNDRGVFTEVSREAGLTQGLSSQAAVWLDYDRDGFLDLYVTDEAAVLADILRSQYEDRDPSTHGRLYRNNGDGGFTDASDAAGFGASLGFQATK